MAVLVLCSHVRMCFNANVRPRHHISTKPSLEAPATDCSTASSINVPHVFHDFLTTAQVAQPCPHLPEKLTFLCLCICRLRGIVWSVTDVEFRRLEICSEHCQMLGAQIPAHALNETWRHQQLLFKQFSISPQRGRKCLLLGPCSIPDYDTPHPKTSAAMAAMQQLSRHKTHDHPHLNCALNVSCLLVSLSGPTMSS